MDKKEYRKQLILFSLVPLICWILLILPYRFSGTDDKLIVYGFFLNICYCSWCLWSDPQPYSLNKIFWVFNIVFLGIIPAYQYNIGHMSWDDHIKPATFIRANGIILAGYIVYTVLRIWLNISYKNLQNRAPVSKHVISIQRFNKAGTAIFLLACLAIVWIFGFKNLWSRQLSYAFATSRFSDTVLLLADKTLRGIIMYFTLLAIWLYRKKQITFGHLIWIIGCCVFVNFPLSLPRYLTATLYIAIFITSGTALLRKRYFFAVSLILLILVIYPMLGLLRYEPQKTFDLLQDVRGIYAQALIYGDFDAYTSICHTIEYVAANGSSHGYQLLGALLFFVPRSIWPTKPIGSGAMIHEPTATGFHNISSPFYAEGIINFGLAGAVIFIAVMTVITTYYDIYYWRRKEEQPAEPTYAHIFYPAALILFFFVLRGDLMSSLAYLTGFCISGYALHWLLHVRKTAV
ncbi:hypothetical protein ACTHGU_17530 [Chitinophagaceae bacterium MMS25-I14]